VVGIGPVKPDDYGAIFDDDCLDTSSSLEYTVTKHLGVLQL